MTTEYKTMRVPEADWKAAKESKHEKETWGEFLQRCTDNPPEVKEFVDVDLDVLEDRLVVRTAREYKSDLQEFERSLDRLEGMTATSQTVDLEATTINKIADEIEGRLR